MSDAYLPGLTVMELARVFKVRRLPLKGEVMVQVGELVKAHTVVARTFVPGRPHLINAANRLNIEPSDLNEAVLKQPGDRVREGELLAKYRAFFGLLRGQCASPVTGTVEHISDITGQITIREPAQPVAVTAYVAGRVSEVLPHEGVVVETNGALIQGIFGVGGEYWGRLRLAVTGPDQVLDARCIREDDRGKILIGGAKVTGKALKLAAERGVRGIVCGGMLDSDLQSFLGYEIGVAITGHEDIGLAVVVTEGFGSLAMADKTFALLAGLEGETASINGSTQIRAGVLRPEVVVPRPGLVGSSQQVASSGLERGTPVRVIRAPWFGQLGRVTRLPVQLQQIDSGARVRVLEVELSSGKRVTVPRANVEILA